MTVLLGLAITPGALADTKDPYLKADESWISISGTAVETDADSFTLDYGEGVITVEMDRWDWYEKDFQVIEGDKVTVYGRIDDDLYETTKIEASSVYDKSRETYYYASSADEEFDDDYDYWIDDDFEVGEMTVRGTVTGVDGREFTIDTGPRKTTVDTIMMSYNPVDAKGYPTIDKGDYVSVTGDMDYDTWEKRELMADTVVMLDND
jgi:hypothetical protein